MANHMKFCGCKYCRAGRHTPRHKHELRATVRRFRHWAKTALRKGDTPPAKIGTDYTD